MKALYQTWYKNSVGLVDMTETTDDTSNNANNNDNISDNTSNIDDITNINEKNEKIEKILNEKGLFEENNYMNKIPKYNGGLTQAEYERMERNRKSAIIRLNNKNRGNINNNNNNSSNINNNNNMNKNKRVRMNIDNNNPYLSDNTNNNDNNSDNLMNYNNIDGFGLFANAILNPAKAKSDLGYEKGKKIEKNIYLIHVNGLQIVV